MGTHVKNRVIKRNGEEVAFDISKIVNAITAANGEVDKLHQMNEYRSWQWLTMWLTGSRNRCMR